MTTVELVLLTVAATLAVRYFRDTQPTPPPPETP